MPNNRFDQDISVPKVPFREAVRETPDHTANATVPLGLALGAGAVTLVGVGLICLGFELSARIAAAAAGIVTMAVLFEWLWRLQHDRMFWTIERIIGQDINQDGMVGQPRQVTHFELHSAPGAIAFGEIDLDPQLVIDWCQAARNQRSLAYSAWEPRFALPDGTKGRERYQAFRDWLVAQNIAEEAGGNVGLRVRWQSPKAAAFVSQFAQVAPGDGTPLLE